MASIILVGSLGIGPFQGIMIARLGDPVAPHSCPQIQDMLASGAGVKSTLLEHAEP